MNYLKAARKINNKIFASRYKKSPRVFFCHVPKCAGSSVKKAIRDRLYKGFWPNEFKINLPATKEAASSLSCSMLSVRETILAYQLSNSVYCFGSGHYPCPPSLREHFESQWHFVTLLRHPISRWISLYTYNRYKQDDWAKEKAVLHEYIDSQRAQKAATVFLRIFSDVNNSATAVQFGPYIEQAVTNITQFSVYGALEAIDEWNLAFYDRFGVTLRLPRFNSSPNPSVSKQLEDDPVLKRKLEELCAPDIEIYNRVMAQVSRQE